MTVNSEISQNISLEEIKERLDRYEEAHKKDVVPWYKSASTWISAAALIFSFGTTFVSYRRTSEQDTQHLRDDLRAALQRTAALAKENVVAYKTYSSDPLTFQAISALISQENNLLSKQAAEAVGRLPKDRVSSTDLYAVGVSLQSSRVFDKALVLFSQAVEMANGLDDEIGALRALASAMFITARPGEGRMNFQKGLDIFAKYKGYDNFTVAMTQILTELNWATAEAGAGFMQNVKPHLDQAEMYVSSISPSPGQQLLKSQIAQARNQIYSGVQLPVNSLIAPAPPLSELKTPIQPDASPGSQSDAR